MRPIVFSLSVATEQLGTSIASAVNGEHRLAEKGAVNEIAASFVSGRPVIGICASGILIRAIAPHLGSKHDDAPVIAVDQTGKNIIPLLGGHHGANNLAKEIATAIGGTAAITTATDQHFGIALDDPPEGYTLANPQHFKAFAARLLAGEKVKIAGSAPWLTNANLPTGEDATLNISVTETEITGSESHLVYHPKTLAIGVGCERGAPRDEVRKLAEICLELGNLSPKAVAVVASIDLKADETAINALSDHLDAPVRFFDADTLNREAPRLHNPSEVVLREVGCPGVAEGASLAAVGPDGRLLIEKIKSRRATCAVARSSLPITELRGRARGIVRVVGLGPGSDEWRSPQATSALLSATEWVGYDLYLDLAEKLSGGKNQHRFPLGDEEVRVRHAFSLAGAGKDVALVCSGDAGIYAMAALVYEVLDSNTLSPDEQRVDIEIVPGISAFQAAAARAGALIGHDFCAISLSDLLTPWETIEKRIHAASEGDFNIAFYNPRSLKRTDHLAKAIGILKPNRQDDTPVIIASNLGRETEKVRTVSFTDFDPAEVDMLTIVLVGSSQSKTITRGDGVTYCYSPRGYANKETQA